MTQWTWHQWLFRDLGAARQTVGAGEPVKGPCQACWLALGGSSGETHTPRPVTVRHASGRVLRIRRSVECRWSSTPRRVHLLSSQGGRFRVLLAHQEAPLVCRRLFSILRSQIQVVSLGGGNRGGDQYTQAKEWCFSLLFKNSASLPFAKAEAGPLLRLEFIKASNMINNLYTWIVIQKKIRNKS